MSTSLAKIRALPPLLIAAIICAPIAAVTLVAFPAPTAPDANAWLSWAHQLSGGNPIDFHYGPSWKPLPVVLSLPAALFSTATASLFWLWCVRIAALFVSCLLFAIATRNGSRLAGVTAAALPLAIPPWLNIALVGDSEAVVMALGLGAILAHRGGRSRLTIVLLTIASLARPELWPMLAAYAIWRVTLREPRAVATAAISAAVVLGGWFLLPWLVAAGHQTQFGMPSGHSLQNATITTVWHNFLAVLPPKAWILIVVGFVGAVLRRDRVTLLVAALAALLVAEITLLWALPLDVSASGYAPVVRYFAPVGILFCVIAGGGADTIKSMLPAGRLQLYASIAILSLVALSIWSSAAENRRQVDRYRTVRLASEQAVSTVNLAGGTKRLERCLPFTVSSFSAIGWSITRRLDLPLSATDTAPRTPSVALNYTGGSWVLGARPPTDTRGRQILASTDLWQVIYYPGNRGCLLSAP
ncbi:MAG: hypothetical protein NT122_03275 [Solirubrobacterales bacterium]|nr:hypothetical protein [Solirubrobacterales bacterium]